VQNDHLNDLNILKQTLQNHCAWFENPLSSIEAFTDLMLQDDVDCSEEEKVVFELN
jgi:hypothetical protein